MSSKGVVANNTRVSYASKVLCIKSQQFENSHMVRRILPSASDWLSIADYLRPIHELLISSRMTIVTEQSARTLDQEIDAVQICPAHPNYLIVATYSLVKKHDGSSEQADEAEETDQDEDASRAETARIGSLQILPFDGDASASVTKQQPGSTIMARHDLPCAVLDIHFHPADETLLGASTSIGELRFFRVRIPPTTTISESQPVTIVSLGVANISSEGSNVVNDTPPLITQFQWLHNTSQLLSDHASVYHLASSDTHGQVKVIKVLIPSTNSRVGPNYLHCMTYLIHEHLYNLEAWTVAFIPLGLESEVSNYVLLSGGDDSCLIISDCKLASQKTLQDGNDQEDAHGFNLELDTAPKRVYLDKHIHTAGVVSILPLPLVPTPNPENTTQPVSLILTGSYDQHIRLWLFDPATRRPGLISDFKLEGGVWRIILLDMYIIQTVQSQSTSNYILLISAMHAGCYIMRLAATFGADGITSSWDWVVEARFTIPHESMVYACAAQRVESNASDDKRWKIASTSFYDKRLCVWEWMDRAY